MAPVREVDSPTTSLERIAVIAYHSSPLIEPGSGDAGGMTVYVRALAGALAKLGLSTDIYTRAQGERDRVVEISPRVRVIPIDAGPRAEIEKLRQPDFIPEFVAGVRAFAAGQRIRYDVVHSHYWQSGLAGKRLAAAWGVPLVHSHHTLGLVKNHWLAPGDPPEPSRRLRGEADVIAAADVLIASTDDEMAHLACLYKAPHDRLKILNPGVDHAMFSPGDRVWARSRIGVEPGYRDDSAVLLFVGRIQPLKGIELAIRSVDQLLPALDRPVELIVVGGAADVAGRAEAERLRRLSHSMGIESSVRFVGPKPHPELVDYYRAADALVVCSYSESFGLAALEAHACGIPVVATAVGGLSHIVGDGESGWLVESRDPAEFAGRLKTLLSDDRLRLRMGGEGLRRSMKFTWEDTARGFVELYECLVTADYPEVCTC